MMIELSNKIFSHSIFDSLGLDRIAYIKFFIIIWINFNYEHRWISIIILY